MVQCLVNVIAKGEKMNTRIRKSVSLLLAFLLMLTFLPTQPAQAISVETSSPIPQGLLEAALESTSYPLAANAQGYRVGGLDFTFNADGLQANSLNWGIALNGFGRGNQVNALSAAETAQIEGRLEYRRVELTEWRRATAFGLEQGFTIPQSPSGKGALVLQLDLSTDLDAVLDEDGRGLSFRSGDGQTLRYDHLRAWDANGAELDAKLVYAPGQIRIVVRDAGATYPVTIDPLIYLEQKALASDGDGADTFGNSVAISGDTAVVGAYTDTPNVNQGSAYVFVRSGSTWTQQAKLLASDGAASDYFGSSVAVSGNTILVGAQGANVGLNSDQGAAYVFIRSGTTWTQQQKLTASDGAASDYFGLSVALDGETALIGAYYDTVGANANQGSAYVFIRSGATWTQQQKLTASDGAASDWFGYSVALDGDTALVGAYKDDVGANPDQGSAYVFFRSGATWSQQQQLTYPSGTTTDYFGYSVALDGDTALVGAYYDDTLSYINNGSAWVFVRDGATWSLQGGLIASDTASGDKFGVSVALSGDVALVGAYYDQVGANSQQGSAYVFVRAGTPETIVWTEKAHITASDGATSDWFGVSVALEGDTALVGSVYDDTGSIFDHGSAYFYQAYFSDADLTVSVATGTANPAKPGDTVLLTASVLNLGPASASAALLDAPLPAGLTYASHTATHGLYSPSNGSWSVGSLAFGVRATLTIRATVNQIPPQTLAFTASTIGTDTNASNDSASLSLVIVPLTATFLSTGANDGWTLESTETSNVGGTLNVAATTFNLGDNAGDKQYRAILHFDTSFLPDTAVIVKVTLKITKQGQVGTNPFTILGGLTVDIRRPYFGSTASLAANDFQAAANKSAVAAFGATPVSNWYSATLSAAGYPYVNRTGATQFRLRFATDDNDNNIADYMKFFSGDYASAASRPTLIIEYYAP